MGRNRKLPRGIDRAFILALGHLLADAPPRIRGTLSPRYRS